MLRRSIALILAAASMCSLALSEADTTPPLERTSAAVGFIESQLALFDHRLYVFRDFNDGVNIFTQKAFMGNNYLNIPEMEEYAQGVSGISGIKARLNFDNHTWGGYMFLNGGLTAGSSNPIPDLGYLPDGYDLTGASKLVFWARGETGSESVEFFMGTLDQGPYPDTSELRTTRYITLSKDWQQYEIDLTVADLSRINNGFGWVTSANYNMGSTEVVFYMDEIYYEFPDKQSPMLLLQSYESAGIETDEYIINNVAYTYDNAMSLMALCYAGKLDRAKQIADALVFVVHNDRDHNDGRIRNAYSSGNPCSFPNWYSKDGTQFARMPGFYDIEAREWYEDRYTQETSVGNAAWLVLGLMEAYRSIGDVVYFETAQIIGDFILTFQSETGGFTGGYEDWNSTPITYKSTEHNIDLISAFALLANASEGTKKLEYQAASDYAKAFVLSMYDSELACFYTGTTLDGVTISKSVLPLDPNTWAVLAMPDFPDRERVMEFVESNMRLGEGYDFNDDRDGIWFEGTAQCAVVYHILGNNERSDAILSYLLENMAADGSITSADRDMVSTGFEWFYGKRTHIGATAWVAFAELGRNPFEVY